jgi:carboxylesterase
MSVGQFAVQFFVQAISNWWGNLRGKARPGALSDERRRLASPFSLGPERADAGAVLVHGFTGTPYEMRLLGEHLAAHDFAVEGPALAGHGPDPERPLRDARWPDWIASAEAALARAHTRTPSGRVAIVGLSMGGLVALEIARRHPDRVRAVVGMSVALRLPPPAMRFDEIVTRISRRVRVDALSLPKIAGSDIADEEQRLQNEIAQGASGMPLAALHSLVELGRAVEPRLHEIAQPTLLLHSRNDHTIPFACMDEIAARLAGPVETVALERSFHVLPLDVERQQVFDAVERHLRRFLLE